MVVLGDASHVYDHALIHPASVPPPTVEFGQLLLSQIDLFHNKPAGDPDSQHNLHLQQYRQPPHLLLRF